MLVINGLEQFELRRIKEGQGMTDEMKKKMRRRHRLLALALVILLALVVMPLPALAETGADGPAVASETVGPAEAPVEEVVPAETGSPVEEEAVEEEQAPEEPPAVEEAPAEEAPLEKDEPAPARSAAPVKKAAPAEEPLVSADSMPPVVNQPPPSPDINLSKTGPDEAYPGQWVTYTLIVSNPGPLDLYNVTLYDDQIGLFKDIGTLAVGATDTTFFDFQIPLNAAGVFPNNAGTTGYGITGQQAVDNDNWQVRIIEPPPPSISVTKSGPDYACVGSEITYTYNVTNTGGWPLSDIELVDDKFGPIMSWMSLAPGESVQATFDVVVGADWESPYCNCATVTASVVYPNDLNGVNGNGNGTVSDTDTHCLTVIDASISLVKTGPEFACVGTDVTYEYTVENTGENTLANVMLVDDKFGAIDSWPSLAPGETVQATFGATVGEDWEDPYVNTGTVTADVMAPNQANGNGLIVCSVSDTDEHSLDVLDPAVSLVKTATPTTGAVGDTITYTYEVTNTGDTDLTNVALVDDQLGAIDDWATLAMGATETATANYVLTQDDVPSITNVATVTAITPCETTVSDTDTATVDVTGAVPAGAITIVKSATESTVVEGDTVTFVLTITNTGQTDIVAPVAVVDTYDATMLSFQSASVAPTSAGGGVITWADASGGAGMAPGESISVSVTFLALAPGTTTNTVTVSAEDSEGTPLASSSSDPVTITSALIPELPVVTPTPVVTAAAPSGVLPVTGADFLGVLLAALILIPLGLLGLTAGAIRRRSRRK